MSTPPVLADVAPIPQDELIPAQIEAIGDSIAPFRDIYERQEGTMEPEINKTLNRGWTPDFVRECKTRCWFNGTKVSEAAYERALFPDQPNFTEALFRGLGYDVDREVVLSLGKRLTELGTQRVRTSSGAFDDIMLNLQEHGDSGEQALIYTREANSPIAYDSFEASLIRAYDIPGAVKIEKTSPDSDRIQKVHAEYSLPAAITWDRKSHTVVLDFDAKLPKEGKKNFITGLMRFIGMNNGRPAQHYQDTAGAVIDLEEILFAEKKSIRLAIDGEPALPDKLNGNRLVLLLSQTAGGFFEGKYYQRTGDNGISIFQNTDTAVVPPNRTQLLAGKTRITTIGLSAAPYSANYYEEEIPLNGEQTAYELKEIRFFSADGSRDFIDISFSTGNGRGMRDLGFFSPREQKGRFKFRVNGRDGFAFGDFTVSPTYRIGGDDGNPVYYTSVVLDPKHSKDMANKRIVLHVVQTREGVYSETQVVPLKVVTPPPFEIED